MLTDDEVTRLAGVIERMTGDTLGVIESIVAAREAAAEQRGREDNADHGMCYVSGSKALAARERDAARRALLDWADELDKPPYDLWDRAAIPRLRERAATYDRADTGDNE